MPAVSARLQAHNRVFVQTSAPNIVPSMQDTVVTLFARTNARHPHRLFGIKSADRLSHMYAIGKTGVGKTTLLETILRSDISRGAGCALIDPHGDFVERVHTWLPAHRQDDLIYLNIPDSIQPFGYNPLSHVSPDRRSLVASGFMDVFKMMWSDAWGPRMEHILRNAVLALLDQPNAIMPDILQLMTSKSFRLNALFHIKNRQVAAFWRDEFPKYTFRYQADGIAPIQNKVGSFLADQRLYRLFTRSDGGPVVHPQLRATILTPINPHSFSQKPLVLPSDQVIETTILTKQNKFGDIQVSLTLDGQTYVSLKRNDQVVARVSDQSARFLRRKEDTFFNTLRNKLKWGEGPE
jgi:hypothetical protein